MRGYLVPLLSVCPLSADQQLKDETETSAFTLQVRAQVPSTGQLLRWLLDALGLLGMFALILVPTSVVLGYPEWRHRLQRRRHPLKRADDDRG